MGLLSGIHDFFLGTDAQKYDVDSDQAKAARTIGDPNHAYDVQAANAGPAAQAQGTQLNTTNYDQVRGQQQGLFSGLNEQAAGRGPSAAVMAGNAQRDSNLTQAAALQSGRRGQSAGVGIRAAGNQVAAGNQQASQAQAIGQANEMATARAQQQGLLGTMAGQDLGVAGQNAQLGQQNSQFNTQSTNQMGQYNAGLQQQAGLANQNSQLGISNAELQQRARQEGLSYSNLEPAQQGFLSPQNAGTFLGSVVSDPHAKSDVREVDGTYGRAMSPRDAKTGVQPATMQLPQLAGTPGVNTTGFGTGPASIGPNQRVNPNWGANSAAAYGNVIGSVLANAALQKRMEMEDMMRKQADQASSQGDKGGDSGGGGMAAMGSSLMGGAAGGGASGGAGEGVAGAIMSNPEILAAFSDERSKSDVRPVSRGQAREMFEEAPAYSYFYKPDAREAGAPEGRQVSVMWDDLQKTPAGRRMDGGREPETGYHTVDYLRGLPAAFASLSDLNARLARLEGSKGGR